MSITTEAADVGSLVNSRRLKVSGRIPQLDGLRGLAIGLVIVWHYFVSIPGGENDAIAGFFRRLFYMSWSGVDLFFILSGFLIGGILLDNRESPRYFKTFYIRRAFRILPVYLLLLLPFWFVHSTTDTSHSPILTDLLGGEVPIWSYGLFLQNFFMTATASFGSKWMGITWSLAIEEQFYLVLPLTLFLVPRRFVPYLCLVCCVVALGIRTTLALTSGSGSAKAAAYLLLPSRMDALFLGVLSAWLVREPRWSQRLISSSRLLQMVIVTLGTGLLVASFQLPYFVSPLMSTVGYSSLAICYLAVMLICLMSKHGPLYSLLISRPLRALGYGSYFIYLFHHLFLQLAHWSLLGQLPQNRCVEDVMATLLAVVVLFSAAAISWRFLEQPLIELGRKATY